MVTPCQPAPRLSGPGTVQRSKLLPGHALWKPWYSCGLLHHLQARYVPWSVASVMWKDQGPFLLETNHPWLGTTLAELPGSYLLWDTGQLPPPSLNPEPQVNPKLPSLCLYTKTSKPESRQGASATHCGHLGGKAKPNTSHLVSWVWGGSGASISDSAAHSPHCRR